MNLNILEKDNGYIFLNNDKNDKFELFKKKNFNSLIVAPAGSGKTYIMITLIKKFLAEDKNNKSWIIDRDGSFKNITNILEGSSVEIKVENEDNVCVNPFVFNENFLNIIDDNLKPSNTKYSEEELEEQNELLSLFVNIAYGFYYNSKFEEDLIKEIKETLRNIFIELIKDKRDNISSEKDTNNMYFNFEEIHNKFITFEFSEEITISNSLDKYATSNLFNGKPNIDNCLLNNIDFGWLQCEKIADLVLSALVLNTLHLSKEDKTKKSLLAIEEVHAVVHVETMLSLQSLSYAFKHSHKYNTFIVLATQGIRDFIKKEFEVSDAQYKLFKDIEQFTNYTFLLGKHCKGDLKKFTNDKEMLKTFEINYTNESDFFYNRNFYIIDKGEFYLSRLESYPLAHILASSNNLEKHLIKLLIHLTNSNAKALLMFSNIYYNDFPCDNYPFNSKYSKYEDISDNIDLKPILNKDLFNKYSSLTTEYDKKYVETFFREVLNKNKLAKINSIINI